jgi:hypothetical protein
VAAQWDKWKGIPFSMRRDANFVSLPKQSAAQIFYVGSGMIAVEGNFCDSAFSAD